MEAIRSGSHIAASWTPHVGTRGPARSSECPAAPAAAAVVDLLTDAVHEAEPYCVSPCNSPGSTPPFVRL